MLTCTDCRVKVHQYCYSPTDKNKSFRCDICKIKKSKPKCFICGIDLGALKLIHPSDAIAISDSKK